MRNLITKSLLIFAFGLYATAASATLIGDSVTANLLAPNSFWEVATPFTSPAVVMSSGGPEFIGSLETSAGPANGYGVALDLHDTSFDITFFDIGGTPGAIALGIARVELYDLDWIGTPSQIVGINGGGTGVYDFGFGPDSAFVAFSGIGSVGVGLNVPTTFELQFSSSAIPEPGTILLLSTGLLGLAGTRRKMKK